MTKNYTFNSQFTGGASMPDFDEYAIKNEPMFFNCDPTFAYIHGGPITRAFMEFLDVSTWAEKPVVFDSRSHMLMPGWIPAIPGWHHDDVPRSRADGQPDYDAPSYHSRHAMALINGEIAPTEFAIGNHTLPKIEGGNGPVYKHWNNMVDDQIENGVLQMVQAPSRQILYFDWQTMHRAVPAVKGGWRWFGRASWQTERKPTNEIRKQVQVYLPAPNEGW